MGGRAVATTQRVRRWWKPDASPSTSGTSTVWLPPTAVTPATIWQLRERMAAAMSAPVLVLVTDGSPERYKELLSEAELTACGRCVEGVRLMAGDGLSVRDGTLSSDGSVAMNFDFPTERAGNASISGSTPKAEPHRQALGELVDWLVAHGRYRWGRLPLLRIGCALFVTLLLAGTVAALLVALDGQYVWLSVPFVGLTGATAAWGLGSSVRDLTARERARVRGVVVRP